jgi:CRP/FNR family transcriptional regulator, cyclic AMP receptor protein
MKPFLELGGSQPPRFVSLLDLDPGLGDLLGPARREAARGAVTVPVLVLGRGLWPVDQAGGVDERHLGLVVVDGLLGRELLADDVTSLELLGPGDFIRPWLDSADPGLTSAEVRWSALSDTRVALLDRRVAERLGSYPEVFAMLLERAAMRARYLAVTQAISQLKRVDRRLLLLMWHLAERWGRVTPQGVALPLALSHRLLAQLVGARRPTVSSALAGLSAAGELVRGPGRTWLLTGEPTGMPDGRTARFIPPRLPTLPASPRPAGVLAASPSPA